MQNDPQFVSYASGPPAIPRERTIFSVVGFLCGLVMALVIAAGALLVSKFAEIFRDFNLQLPGVTQILVDANELLFKVYFTPLVLLPILFGFLLPLIDFLIPFPPTQRRFLRGGAGLLLTYVLLSALIIVVIFALFMPMVSLIQGMSAGGGKR